MLRRYLLGQEVESDPILRVRVINIFILDICLQRLELFELIPELLDPVIGGLDRELLIVTSKLFSELI